MGRFWAVMPILPGPPTIPAHPIRLADLNGQRAAFGGAVALTSGATVAVDATAGVFFRLSADRGTIQVSPPTGGTDTQEILLEVTAATGALSLTFAAGGPPSWETGGLVTSRSFTIPSGLVGYVRAVNRGGVNGVWRLLAADPGA